MAVNVCEIITNRGEKCKKDWIFEVGREKLDCVRYCAGHCLTVFTSILKTLPKVVTIVNDKDRTRLAKKIVHLEIILKTDDVDLRLHWYYKDHIWRIQRVSYDPDIPEFDIEHKKLSNNVINTVCQMFTSLQPGDLLELYCRVNTETVTKRELKRLFPREEHDGLTMFESLDKYHNHLRVIFPEFRDNTWFQAPWRWKVANTVYENNSLNIVAEMYRFSIPSNRPLIRKLDSSQYLDKTGSNSDKSKCNNEREYLSSEEIKEMKDEEIITFVLNDKSHMCFDLSFLEAFWESSGSFNYGKCWGGKSAGEDIENCEPYYKIPGDITLYIDKPTKDLILELASKGFLVWDLKPFETVKMGRGLHYISEYNNPREIIYDAVPSY